MANGFYRVFVNIGPIKAGRHKTCITNITSTYQTKLVFITDFPHGVDLFAAVISLEQVSDENDKVTAKLSLAFEILYLVQSNDSPVTFIESATREHHFRAFSWKLFQNAHL